MEHRDAKLAALEEEMAATKENLASVQEELVAAKLILTTTEDRLDKLETYSRRNCLLINGDPEHPDEYTDALLLDLGRS